MAEILMHDIGDGASNFAFEGRKILCEETTTQSHIHHDVKF